VIPTEPKPNLGIDSGTTGGDPGAGGRYEEFLRLFTRDHERVFRYIYSLLPHHADAEDVFQQCSLLLWRKFAEFDRTGSFLAWACGIAFYEVRNFMRVAGRKRMQLDIDLLSQLAERRLDSFQRDEDRVAALRRCLEKLSGTERELVQLVYCGDSSVKELAERTGRATQTLYNQLSQVRRKLFHCVQCTLAQQG
jgi:RNA polymerase sigma-70 factor (ECF subfamily)